MTGFFKHILNLIWKLAIGPLIVLLCFELTLRYVFHNTFLKQFQQELEHKLQGDISFADVDITTITDFPRATLTIDSLSIVDQDNELFKADVIKISLDLYDFYKGSDAVKQLDLTGVQLYLSIDSTGQLLALKATDKDSSSSKGNVKMEIPEIYVKDLSIFIENKLENSQIQMTLDSGVFQQKSSGDLFEIKGDAFMTVDTRMNTLSLAQQNPRLQLDLQIKNADPTDTNTAPYINVDFKVEEVIHRLSGIKSEESDSLNLKGNYTNGPNRNLNSSEIVIDYGNLRFYDSYFMFSGKLQNFDNPYITLDLNSDIELMDLKTLMHIENIDMSGNILMLANIKSDLATLKEEMESINDVAVATLTLDHINIVDKSSDISLKNMNGQMSIRDTQLGINRLHGMYNGMALSVQGELDNFLPLIEQKKGQNSKVNLNVHVKNVEIPSDKNQREKELLAEKDLQIEKGLIPDFLELNLDLWMNQIVYDSLFISDLSLSLFANKDHLNLRNAKFKFEKGTVELKAISTIDNKQRLNSQVWLTADLPYLNVDKYLLPTDENDSTPSTTNIPSINVELESDIKIGYFKYDDLTLDQLHIKSQLITESSSTKSHPTINIGLDSEISLGHVNYKDIELDQLYFQGQLNSDSLSVALSYSDVPFHLASELRIEHVQSNDISLDQVDVKSQLNSDSSSVSNLQFNFPFGLASAVSIAHLKYNNIYLDHLNLNSHLNSESLRVSKSQFDFPFGHLNSTFVLDWTDSTYSLNGSSIAHLPKLHVDSLKGYYNTLDWGQNGQDSTEETDMTFRIEEYALNLSAPGIVYEDYHLKNVSSNLLFKGNDINLKNASFDLYDGTFVVGGVFNDDANGHINLSCDLVAMDLSLGEIITKFGTEDQDLFGEEHFEGRIDLDGHIRLKYDQELDHREEDMLGEINLSLRDGKVIDFTPISESLVFIKHEYTDVIYLANPSVKVLFHNDDIVIPKTTFKTNLTNIELSGFHSKEVDYRFDMMISMGDLLLKSQQKKVDEVAVEIDSTEFGKLKHHLSVQTIEEEFGVLSLSKKKYDEQLAKHGIRHQLIDSLLQISKRKSDR
jgi:hypothetical protein